MNVEKSYANLPFHRILYYCEPETVANCICISTISRTVVTSDLIKGLVRRLQVSGTNPLRWAAQNGQVRVLRYLASHGYNVRGDEDRLLCFASSLGQLHIVSYL